MLDFRTAAALRDKAVPITPECPAWRYLVRRGIPDEVIQANAGELLYLEANIPGRPLGEHALVALIRDAGAGAETGFQTSFCGPDGERVARTTDSSDKRTWILERHGSLKGLFLAGTVAEDGVLCVTEGRAEKALAVAAAGYAAVGYGGRQVLGRQPLPPDARTIIVVPDKRPAVRLGADMLKAATRATAHDYDYARGIARLEAAGAVVLRMPDFECDCCKDADDCFRAHGADALREMIARAEPAPKTVVGEVLKLAMISDGALRDQALREAAKALKVGLRELRAAVVKQRRKAARQRREDEATTAPVGQAERQPPFVVVHQAYRTKHGQMRQPGVYYEQTDADGNTVLAWVCSPLEVLGRNRDAASEEWGMLLRVTDPDDNRHEWAMPASLLAGRGDEMRGELLGLGLQISPTNAARYWLAEYVQTWRTSARYRCVDRLGWHGDTFVMPRQVFGAPIGSDEVLFQHRHARDIPKFEQAGTLEGWRDEVAAPAVGNSRLILMLSAAFAGPLVRPIGEESGGIHFFGSSSTGKTTGLRCACSVWGIAHHQWRASDNAIEATAACACDGLLPLDETGQAAPRALAATAYMLANQAGKARMSRSGNRNRPVLTWVLLFLSTGELPLTLQLAQAGIPAQAGQQVRMIEMPADAGTGHGLFEDLHGSADGAAFAQRLTAAAQRHRGHAALLFLEHLTADRPAAAAMVAATMQAWREDNLPAGATGQVSRVAGRFALIAAAGELAAAWGVVPWPAGTASAGVTECFQAWLAHRGGAGPAEIRDGIAQIRMFLEQYGSSRFEAAWEERGPSDPYVQQRAGFRRRELLSGDGFPTARTYGPWEYFVLPEVWRAEVCKGFDHGMIARAMAAQGSLKLGEGRNLARKVTIPGQGERRVYFVLSSAFDETLSEASEVSETPLNPRAPAPPTEKAPVGGVGGANEVFPSSSDTPDMPNSCRRSENTSGINALPTSPTPPTDFGTTQEPNQKRAAHSAALTCEQPGCENAFPRPARGRPPRFCPAHGRSRIKGADTSRRVERLS